MTDAIEKMLGFCADINQNEINDHIDVSNEGDMMIVGIDVEWVESWRRAAFKTLSDINRDHVELPKDADGVTIHVGDRVYYSHNGVSNSVAETVGWIAIGESETHVTTKYNSYSRPDVLRHYHAPTVEDVLTECKFTVESSEGLNSATSDKRVTFEGYATDALYEALIDSIKEVLK